MSLDFVRDNLLMFVGGGVCLFVIIQASFFLRKAMKQGKAMGMNGAKIKKAVSSSAIFAIVPSIAILITVLTLSKALGLGLPWLRLSVIGSLAYELPAAESAAAAFGLNISNTITDPAAFSTIAWVMTAGSLIPLLMMLFLFKKVQGGLSKIGQKDKRWGEIFTSAIFIGLIASFVGYALAGSVSSDPVTGQETVFGSLLSVMVLLCSALIMGICAFFIYKKGQKWLENFALPFSMIGSMAAAILFWNMLPEALRSWRFPGIFGGGA